MQIRLSITRKSAARSRPRPNRSPRDAADLSLSEVVICLTSSEARHNRERDRQPNLLCAWDIENSWGMAHMQRAS
jgi:hypothetical protein